MWWYKYLQASIWIFLSSDASCTASSECISGEGCSSAGVCGTCIYSLCSWHGLNIIMNFKRIADGKQITAI